MSHCVEGHFVRAIGTVGDVNTETECIMIENGLSALPFGELQIRELPTDTPSQPWRVSEEERLRRRDIRESHLVFSIDPLGCEDVDDALSVRRLPSGAIELGVHIADVSYFVRPGGLGRVACGSLRSGMLTDAEAQRRATTVYLADRRYDMLPAILSAQLCSLLCEQDRYAMSVFWMLSPVGKVLSTWYGRTIIRSAYQLHYELAQDIQNGLSDADTIRRIPSLTRVDKSAATKRVGQLREAVALLTDVARILKRSRSALGALELESAEVRVALDASGQVKQLLPKDHIEMHEIVAECMIFANCAVAVKISECFPSVALLRHHPRPFPEQFRPLIESAAAKGFTVDVSSNRALAASLDACVDENDPEFNHLLRVQATQAMEEAAYFCCGSVDVADWPHYGLGLDRYTHFTSPIRRYADTTVHRLLMAALRVAPNKGESPHTYDLAEYNQTEIDQICDHINLKNRASKVAQQESTEFFIALYYQARYVSRAYAPLTIRAATPQACEVDGVVARLRDKSVLVYAPTLGLRCPVSLTELPARVFGPGLSATELVQCTPRLSGGRMVVASSDGRSASLALFDHVRVRIQTVTSPYRRPQVAMALVALLPTHGAPTEVHRAKPAAFLPDRSEAAGNYAPAPEKHAPHKESLYDIIENMTELSLRDDW